MPGVPVFAFIVYPLFSRIRLFPLSSSLKFKCDGRLTMGKNTVQAFLTSVKRDLEPTSNC